MKRNLLEKIKDGLTYMDGGMGTQLQARGLRAGELPEMWCLTHSEDVIQIHEAYYAAGSHVITSNTFGANAMKYTGRDGMPTVEEIVGAALDCAGAARAWADDRMPTREHYVALDLGPTGHLIEPFGDLAFEDAVALFGQIVCAGVAHGGVDVLLIETMNDIAETRAALLAAKENGEGLPIFVTNAYSARGALLSGTSAEGMAELLGAMGVAAFGLNCSLGPQEMLPVVKKLVSHAVVPVLVSPNAGLPETDEQTGATRYGVDPAAFAAGMVEIVRAGARLIGGCCGTTPAHIRAMVEATEAMELPQVDYIMPVCLTSRTKVLPLDREDDEPLIVGECINPSGRAALGDAIREDEWDDVIDLAMDQVDSDAQVLDVNVAVGDGQESEHMRRAVAELQGVVNCPLMLDSSSLTAVEAGLRIYHGRGVINSTTGRQARFAEAVALAKKYGAFLVLLTMDEGGIPTDAAGRYAIAERMVNLAGEMGLDRSQMIVDPLTMPEYTAEDARQVTMDALQMVKKKLGVRTILGISNASYGMRDRQSINEAYLADVMNAGVDMVIVNPMKISNI